MPRAVWNTHGMLYDLEDCLNATDDLGLMPDELVALADFCAFEARIWEDVARHFSGQDKRKRNLIAKHFRIRARRWKELAALTEQAVTEYEKENA